MLSSLFPLFCPMRRFTPLSIPQGTSFSYYTSQFMLLFLFPNCKAMLQKEDFQPASVIACCANPLPENIVSQYGKRIIKISDHEAVKWGPDVTNEEAENQQIAYKRVDRRIVRIPRVYAFFSDEQGWGYIVMEFIKGRIIDLLEDRSAVRKVAGVLDHFATLQHRSVPGYSTSKHLVAGGWFSLPA